MDICFFYLNDSFSFSNRSAFKRLLALIFHEEKQVYKSVSVIFCSDDYLLNINRQFLQHDYYTDIITFNLSDIGEPITGEVYISIDRVKDNAAKLGLSFKKELHRVIIHGVLHLCGYKDKRITDFKLMRSKEDYYLERYFKRST